MIAFSMPIHLVLAACTLLGLYLSIRGFKGRREGREQRCKKCGYNLTGLTAGRCPECGSTLSSSTIEYGVRRRYPATLALGAILLLSSSALWGLLAYGIARNIEWYQFAPYFYVMGDARSGSQKGLRELERRLDTDSLSVPQIEELADTCLELQQKDPAPVELGRWLDMLDRFDAAGRLTNEQQTRYYDRLVVFSLDVRPRIRVADPVPYRIRTEGRGPRGDWVRCSVKRQRIKVGERSKSIGSSRSSSVGVRETAWTTTTKIDGLSPGRHTVEVVLAYELTRGTLALRTGEIVLNAETTILPEDAADPVALNNDPGARRALEQSISVENMELIELKETTYDRSGAPTEGYFLQLQYHLHPDEPLPADIAFEVIIQAGEQEFDAGKITGAKGSQTAWFQQLRVPELAVDHVFVILRPDPEAVRTTVDVFECLNGELRLGPVAIRRSLPFR